MSFQDMLQRKLCESQKLQFSSVTQLCPTLCDPMDYSTPGFPVLHQLLEPKFIEVRNLSRYEGQLRNVN